MDPCQLTTSSPQKEPARRLPLYYTAVNHFRRTYHSFSFKVLHLNIISTTFSIVNLSEDCAHPAYLASIIFGGWAVTVRARSRPDDILDQDMPPKRTASAVVEDFDSLKVAELKDECTKRGLAVDGKKADLVQRLKEHEAGAGKKTKTEGLSVNCFSIHLI